MQPGNGYLRPESQATEFASNTNEPGSDFFLNPPDQCLAREHLDFQPGDALSSLPARKDELRSAGCLHLLVPVVARQPRQVNTSLDQETLGQWGNLLLRPQLLGLFREITPLVPLPVSYPTR